MKTLEHWQEDLGRWQVETFGPGGLDCAPSLLKHLQEEVQELLLEIYSPEFNRERTGEELADIMILTISLADRLGIPLEAALTAKMKKNRARTQMVATRSRRGSTTR